jgi:lipid kinase, YegS/Rv2252/BmrU family
MKKTVYAIINPVSGKGSKAKIKDLLSDMNNESYEVTLFQTEYPNHATEIAQKAVENKIDIVVAVGGDGTINEIAGALVGSNVALGIIPCGSGNGLSRHLCIPMSAKKALDIIKNGHVERIDYGKANDRLFFCTCGVGYDAKVSEKALTQKKRGILMYAKNMITTFISYKPESYKIVCEEQIFENEVYVITFSNASQYGNNAYIAPRATVRDGKMNIAILKPISFINLPVLMTQMFTKRITNNKKFFEIVASKATIIREREGVMHLDGNAVYEAKEVNIEIIPEGLNVFIPQHKSSVI